MQIGGLAARYAQAVIDLGLPPAEFTKVQKEISQFAALYAGSAELPNLFDNPSFSVDERKAVLVKLSEKMSLSPTTRNFLSLLVDKDRTRLIPEVAYGLEQHADTTAGVVRAIVKVADELKPAQTKKLTDSLTKLAGRPVRVDTRVDSTVMGGVVVEMDGKVYDGSVRTRLERLRESILEETR